MTPSPLSQSRKITQELEETKPFKGFLWVVVIHQWVGVLGWTLAFMTACTGDSLLVLWMAFVFLMLWAGNCWLMHKRRALFVWMFLVQTFFEFGLLVPLAERDSDIIGWGFGALILAVYVVFGYRPTQTFTRTMEEPTR